jgi:hypothetical protein
LTSDVVDTETDAVTSQSAELRRIDFTGTIWFAAASATLGITLAILVSSGWRPSELPSLAMALWWIGAAAASVGTAGLAWAGCPVLGFSPDQADRQKSVCIRFGVGLYISGSMLAALTVLASP